MKRNKQMLLAAVVLIATCSHGLAKEPSEAKKPEAQKKPGTMAPQVEVCFVLDTTGSMSALIQGAKDKIWSIANELVAAKPTPNIKFGLVAYRDRKDAYVTKVFDLSDDIDAIYEELMAFKAGGGGDTPESVNQALHESVMKMSWSEGRRVLKIVFLVGDAPPHMDYKDDVKYPEVCKLAMEKSLIINTIQCGSLASTAPIWNDIARRSEGQYAAILQSGGTVAIATPFDKDIAAVNTRLNATIVGYGDAQVQRAVEGKVAANAAAKSEAVADRADFFRNLRGAEGPGGGGFGGKVLGGEDDLVEQVIQNKIKLDDIEAAKLPNDLKKLKPEEQVAAIKKRVEERKKLQQQIDELLKKRSEFVSKEKERQAKEGKAESFDLKVKEIIKTQGATKGIDFDTSGK